MKALVSGKPGWVWQLPWGHTAVLSHSVPNGNGVIGLWCNFAPETHINCDAGLFLFTIYASYVWRQKA